MHSPLNLRGLSPRDILVPRVPRQHRWRTQAHRSSCSWGRVRLGVSLGLSRSADCRTVNHPLNTTTFICHSECRGPRGAEPLDTQRTCEAGDLASPCGPGLLALGCLWDFFLCSLRCGPVAPWVCGVIVHQIQTVQAVILHVLLLCLSGSSGPTPRKSLGVTWLCACVSVSWFG